MRLQNWNGKNRVRSSFNRGLVKNGAERESCFGEGKQRLGSGAMVMVVVLKMTRNSPNV